MKSKKIRIFSLLSLLVKFFYYKALSAIVTKILTSSLIRWMAIKLIHDHAKGKEVIDVTWRKRVYNQPKSVMYHLNGSLSYGIIYG